MNSSLERELRALGGVELVTNGDWEIGVLAMEVKVGEHQKGFALSTVIIQRVPPAAMAEPEQKELEEERPNRYYRHEHWLTIGGNLQKLCTDMIRDFDRKILQQYR